MLSESSATTTYSHQVCPIGHVVGPNGRLSRQPSAFRRCSNRALATVMLIAADVMITTVSQ